MFLKLKLILLSCIILLAIGCDKNGSGPTKVETPEEIIKSSKRGLAYNLTDSADMEALKDGVSWWYNWYYKTDAEDGYYDNYQMEFIPMLWGGNPSNNDIVQLKSFILQYPEVEYLLVLNEPNLTDQANLTPESAVDAWKIYEQVASDLEAQGRTIYLVGPAMNWGTLANYSDPVIWLDAFYAAYKQENEGRDPRIDYLAFHWYDYGLAGQLDRLAKYGKQIWITEMANWNSQIDSYSKQIQQMQEMVALCESRDDVFRYAWFIGRGFENRFTNIFNTDPGDLNALGNLYINLPY